MKSPFTGIRTILPHRIWQQIFFLLVFLVIIPLVLLGSLLIHTSQNAVRTSVLRDHKKLAIHASGEVREHFDGAKQALLVTAATLGILHADPWRQETAIVELSLRYPVFRRIASVDLQGKEIATSELGTPLRDRSQEKAFVQAKSGESYISDVRIPENHVPNLTIAMPIRQLGKIRSVLMAEVSLRGIWEVVDSIQFGKTGKAYLIDNQGRIISHPDKKLVLKNASSLHPKVVEDVLIGRAGNTEEIDREGERWLVSYAPIEKLNWGLVITQSAKEAYAFSNVMKIESWVLIILSVIATVFMSLILSRFMSRPMNMIIEGTGRLAKGNFNNSFRIKRRDEIGKLLYAFNKMALKLRNAQQMERLSAVGKAATAIAHELKNSLVLINTFIQLLPKRHDDKEFMKEFSQTIPKELDSWKAMLQNMMEFPKLNNLPMTDLDVNALVNDIVSLTRLRIKQKNIHFDVRLQSNHAKIIGNEDKLKQVFLNLITNSVEATTRGGTITLAMDFIEDSELEKTSYMEIKISNTGKGIARDKLEKIFEPFYTTKNNGLGLGLSISQEIVKLHGGYIEVVNEENKGTCFTVRIPVNQKLQKNRLPNEYIL